MLTVIPSAGIELTLNHKVVRHIYDLPSTVCEVTLPHSGDEMCELDDSDVGSEFEAAMGESASSMESGVSNFDSDDERVCDVLRRRLGGSPVWTTNMSESRMDIGELDMSMV